MGIESRDYFRESSRYTTSGWSAGDVSSVVKKLIIANIVVLLLQYFVTRAPGVSIVEEWFVLDTEKVLSGQIWRLVTCAFCHSQETIWHIVFNMLFLYWFGVTLERMYGSREFLLFYLTAAIIASVAHVGLDLATGRSSQALGASGAVMAVMMLYAIFYPRHTIYVMFIIPVEVRWLVVIYAIYDLHPVLLELSGKQQATGIAHAAHLGGLAFGFLYWKLGLKLEKYLGGLQTPRFTSYRAARRGMRVYNPEEVSGHNESGHDELDDRLDSILQKIHEEGEDSLTPDEHSVLKAASQKYKKRTSRP